MLEPLTFPVTTWAPSERPRTASSAERVHRIFTVKWTRCRYFDPDDQDRAGTARLRNGCCSRSGTPSIVPGSYEVTPAGRIPMLGYSRET
jgi:hypothetical protein